MARKGVEIEAEMRRAFSISSFPGAISWLLRLPQAKKTAINFERKSCSYSEARVLALLIPTQQSHIFL
jgi:hypothetical protein